MKYIAIAKDAYTKESITIINKDGMLELIEGNFVCVDLFLYQKESSKQSEHTIDSEDFKLKNHTG